MIKIEVMYSKTYVLLLILVHLILSCSEPSELKNESVDDVEIFSTETLHRPSNTMNPYVKYDSLILEHKTDSIWFSEKVQEKEIEIQKLSNNERGLNIIYRDMENEIMVNLAEDNGGSWVTHLKFIISPEENWKIDFYDPINDVRVNFNEWNRK